MGINVMGIFVNKELMLYNCYQTVNLVATGNIFKVCFICILDTNLA